MRMIFSVFRDLIMFYFIRIRLKKQNVTLHITSRVNENTRFEGCNLLANGARLYNSKIGYGSYLASNTKFSNVQIGRYSSIGPNVSIVCGHHPTKEFVSTHPAFYSLKKQAGMTYVDKQLFNEQRFANNDEKIQLIIGNDVWIGQEARILEGICINDGAIIAAGAIVTKDVPPYAIVGGVPAKIIKFRFNESDIKFLMDMKWWNKDEMWIRENAHLFINLDLMKESLLKNDD